jgi:hypothetical protein
VQLIPAQSWEDPLPIPDGENPDQAIINSDWYKQICHPIVKAMYKRDWDAATRLHQEAQCLDLHGLSREDRERIRLQLMYLEFQMHIGMRRLERIQTILPVIDEVFRTAKGDPLTDFQRRKLRLEIHLILDLSGIRAADSGDIERLAYNDTSRHWPFDVWIMLSYWAFIHRNEDLLLHANNRMITMCEDNKIYAWYIQRNLVMQMLLTGEATADDMIWLIDTVELISQLESVGGRIRKTAVEHGVWNDKVANAFRTMMDTMSRTNNTAVDIYCQKSKQATLAS